MFTIILIRIMNLLLLSVILHDIQYLLVNTFVLIRNIEIIKGFIRSIQVKCH